MGSEDTPGSGSYPDYANNRYVKVLGSKNTPGSRSYPDYANYRYVKILGSYTHPAPDPIRIMQTIGK